MKKKIYTLLCCLIGVGSLSSCSDWFDISPKTDVKADELFETESGFMSALAGIYIKMTEEQTYGGNLSFGMLDQLALVYDEVPNGATEKTDIFRYDVTTDYGYNTKTRLASTWLGAYNLIANANNLLRWLDKNGESVINSKETRDMLRGEAYAIRAFIHFDLLRCWGPMSYATESGVACIPYRTVADNSKQPLLTAAQVVTNILTDLKEAEKLLAFEKGVSLTTEFGYSERRFRFNYYAVKALMARVYNYSGDASNASLCAGEVIADCGLSLQTDNAADPVLFEETICGLNLYQMDENITGYFAASSEVSGLYTTNFNTFQTLLEATGTSGDADIRVKTGAITIFNATKVYSRKYLKNDNAVIPLIRLPEMYYIMCEAASLADAPQYINTVRSRRGYTRADSYSQFLDEQARMNALNLEYRKEFYAEGQYFYFLKRNGISRLDYYPGYAMGAAEYVFPLPDAEKEYGWTANGAENN